MQSWDGLDAFVAVAEAGNFTRAAGRLGVSISQVSREIHRLEERLGTQLLVRNTRRVALTESGRLFEQRCRPCWPQQFKAWGSANFLISTCMTI